MMNGFSPTVERQEASTDAWLRCPRLRLGLLSGRMRKEKSGPTGRHQICLAGHCLPAERIETTCRPGGEPLDDVLNAQHAAFCIAQVGMTETGAELEKAGPTRGRRQTIARVENRMQILAQ